MHPTPRWSSVLFDLDGTLANTIDVIIYSYQHAIREVLGQEVSDAEAKSWIGRTLPDIFNELSPQHAGELERIYRSFNEAHLAEYVTGYLGIPELLADLVAAGVKVGVATSRRRSSSLLVLPLAGLPDDLLLASTMDDTDRHKPDPAPLLHGLQAMEAAAADSVYVGDSVFDLQAAAAAGMAGIGVSWGAGQRDALAEQPQVAIVDDATQLRELLLG